MSVLSGFKKYKNYKADSNGDHQLQSFWTSSDTVEVDTTTNKTLTSKLSDIDSDISGKISTSEKGAANGVAELDSNGFVPSSQLPSFVDDIIEGYYKESNGKFYKESAYTTEISGESGKIYVSLDTNKTYRWSGTAFVVVSETLALGETSSTAYRGDRGKEAYDHATDSNKISTAITSGFYKFGATSEGHISSTTSVEKSDLTGLGVADNTPTFTQASTRANIASTESMPTILGKISKWFADLGTAAFKNVPSSGNASTSQVVMGDDTRLTDARNAADVSAWAKAESKPSYTASEVGALPDTTKYAGSSSAGGAATSAAKLTNTSKVGDTNKPVYFTANGVPAAISYEVNKSVPSDAKFTDTTYSDATTSASGLMSSTDKTKLNGIATGAEVNQNAFSNVKVGTTTIEADGKTDTLELAAGSNVTLTPDASGDKVTIAATDTTYSDATTSASGLMSSSDKTKLNGIASGAEVNQNAFSNVVVGTTTIAADGKTDTLTLAAGSNVTLTPDATNDKVTIAATDTTYESKAAASGGTAGSLVTTGEKYTWNNKSDFDGAYSSLSGKPTLGTAAAKDTTDTYSSTGTNPITGKGVAAALGTLDVTEVGGTNKYISKISETDGKISATAGTIDTSVTSGSSNLVTSGAVYTAIDNLPEPMIFKGSLGTGGTITTLPTAAASNEGYTYKVITAGTYASQAAKVGDLFISNGSSWVWIPSGDEPSGTVTSVKITATSPIAIDSDAAITSSGTRTLSHANSGATAGSYGDSSAQTPSYGGTFKVPYVTVNATGHVTSISEHTVKIPASDNTNTHRPIQVNGTQILGDNTTALNLKAGSNVSLSNSSGTVTIAATDTTYSNATQSAAGLMSSTDKTKLDGVATGATANIGTVTQVKVGTTAYDPTSGVISLPAYPSDTNTHRPIQMNGTEILGNNTTALNLKAGSNVTLTNSSGTVTIAATDTTYGNVSASAAGLAPKGAAVSTQSQSTKFLREDGSWAAPSYTTNTNTTYTFANGTNGFTVTPSGGSAQTVTVTPSITNNVTGSGTSGYIAKFNGANTITNGPAFGNSVSSYLRNDGSWVNPLNLGTATYIQYTENSDTHTVRPTDDGDYFSNTGHDRFPTVYAVKSYINSNLGNITFKTFFNVNSFSLTFDEAFSSTKGGSLFFFNANQNTVAMVNLGANDQQLIVYVLHGARTYTAAYSNNQKTVTITPNTTLWGLTTVIANHN